MAFTITPAGHMPQRRTPELRPVMRPPYGACSACFAGEIQGAGRWTGGGRVLLHLQRDLQQKRLRRDGATFLSPPKGYYLVLSTITNTRLKIINTRLKITNTRQSADHAVTPTTNASRGGQAQIATMSGGSVCDRVARPSADPRSHRAKPASRQGA